MKLHFRRLGLLCFAAGLAFTPACGSDAADDDDDDDEGCDKDSECRAPRICIDHECTDVSVSSGGTNSSGATGGTGGGNSPGTGGSTGGSGSTGGTSATGGGPTTGGTAGATGGTTGGTGDGTGGSTAGTSGSGGSGGTPACLETDPPACISDDEMSVCIEGVVEPYTCSVACPEIGLGTIPCVEGEGCCGDLLDEECGLGASAYITCAELPEDAFFDYYLHCYLDEVPADTEILRCLAGQVADSMIDCEAAATACLPAEEEPAPGAAGAPGAP